MEPEIIDQIGTLETILEASLVLLGFSGAVVALGDKPPREWSGVNSMRIWTLIGASMTPLIVSSGLIVLLYADVGLRVTMQIGSAICAALLLYFAIQILRLNLKIPREDPDRISGALLLFFQVTGYAAAGLLIWNALFVGAFWPIALALFLGLIHAARMFARLLFRPL